MLYRDITQCTDRGQNGYSKQNVHEGTQRMHMIIRDRYDGCLTLSVASEQTVGLHSAKACSMTRVA